jgi:hypothetical protein
MALFHLSLLVGALATGDFSPCMSVVRPSNEAFCSSAARVPELLLLFHQLSIVPINTNLQGEIRLSQRLSICSIARRKASSGAISFVVV